MKIMKEMSRRRKINIITIVTIVIIVLSTFSTSFGRYAINAIYDYYLRTKEFYFYSNQMSMGEGNVYQINNWTGTGTYTFNISLNSRRNNLLSTSSDITYEFKATNSSNVTLSFPNDTPDPSTGIITRTIPGSANDTAPVKNSDSIEVILSVNTLNGEGLQDGDVATVEFTATSTDPYTKTIKGTYSLVVGTEIMSYTIEDEANQKYLNINVTNAKSYYIAKTAFTYNGVTYNVNDRVDEGTYNNLSDTQKGYCQSTRVRIAFDPNYVVMDMGNVNYLSVKGTPDEETTTITHNGNNYTYVNAITVELKPLSSIRVRLYKNDITQNYSSGMAGNTQIITVTEVT